MTANQPPDDQLERRVRFFLGVLIILVTFGYIIASAFTQGTERPLALPEWKYAIPFILVAFIVVFQLDLKDLRSILRIVLGGVLADAKDEERKDA
jgi:hypothetical protein